MIEFIQAHLVETLAFILAIVGFLYTRNRDHKMDARVSRIEEETKKEKEALALRHERANSPHFFPDPNPAQSVINETTGKSLSYFTKNILSEAYLEVEEGATQGHPLVVILRNAGAPWRKLGIGRSEVPDLSIHQSRIELGGDLFLHYPYDPSKHGEPQVFEILIDADSGDRFTHIYELSHGIYSLRRVYPE